MPGMEWEQQPVMAIKGNGVSAGSNSAVALSAPSVLIYYSRCAREYLDPLVHSKTGGNRQA